jgi:hypothetical protein
MNHRLLSKVSVIAALVMIVCCVVMSSTPALAQWEDSNVSRGLDRGCSNKTLSSDYGFASQGVLLNVPGVPPGTPFRSVGLAHFDGKGNLTWVEHTVVGGVPLDTGWTPASGTYSVNRDCTGTAVVYTPNSPVPLNLAFVVVRHGNEVHTVLDANAITTVFTKVD